MPDVEAAVAFYSGLFGWDIEIGPAEMGHYSMARIRGLDVAALADQQVPGMVRWTTYLAVDDLDAAMEKVVPAGGSVITEAMDVMTFGRMAIIADPGGCAVALWQAGDHIGARLVNEAGTLCWNELTTRDPQGAMAFLEAVVGLKGKQAASAADGEYFEFHSPSDRPVGGLMPMLGDMWPADLPDHWTVYFAVDDTDAAVAKCEELGGQVCVPATDIPPGRFAVLSDPQGGMFSVIKMAIDHG